MASMGWRGGGQELDEFVTYASDVDGPDGPQLREMDRRIQGEWEEPHKRAVGQTQRKLLIPAMFALLLLLCCGGGLALFLSTRKGSSSSSAEQPADPAELPTLIEELGALPHLTRDTFQAAAERHARQVGEQASALVELPVALLPYAAAAQPMLNATGFCSAYDAGREAAAAASKAHRVAIQLAKPFHCRADSYVLGEWTADGHEYMPRTLVHPSGLRTELPVGTRYELYHTRTLKNCVRGKHIYFLGSSYLRDVFTTLRDMLHRFVRTKYLQMNPPALNATLLGGPPEDAHAFDSIQLLSIRGFFHDYSKVVLGNLATLRGNTVIADVLIWDIMKAQVELFSGDRHMLVELYFLNLRRFLRLCRANRIRLLWVTQMSSQAGQRSTVPLQYLAHQNDEIVSALIRRQVDLLEEYDIPWFDVFHMTSSCVTDPRETDPGQPCNPSGHSQWYVSRMKLQMLLNYLCRCNEDRGRGDGVVEPELAQELTSGNMPNP